MVLRRVSLLLGQPHGCPYLPEREARLAWLDRDWLRMPGVYGRLAEVGFRRSGGEVYRPHCPACAACVPVRLPVTEFVPDRSQRRAWARNNDVSASEVRAEFREDHYRLYLRYQQSRHADGEMGQASQSDYLAFLACAWQETVFIEFRQQDRLLAVTVADRLAEGLSAVYTFYDPEEKQRSLGTYAVLYLIKRASALGLRWCYLGYWVGGSQKMDYKRRFRPFEARIANRWVRVEAGQDIPGPDAASGAVV